MVICITWRKNCSFCYAREIRYMVNNTVLYPVIINKKQIVKAMMQLWESYFAENLQFKRDYEIKYEGEAILNIFLQNLNGINFKLQLII